MATDTVTDTASLSFLPWVRQGAAAGIVKPDQLGTAVQPGSVKLDATVRVNNTLAASLPVRLLGPADVLGIDPRQIVRTDPLAGSAGFEPNKLVAIEFDRADFPWLFTPASADPNGRLRPWLCLIVLRQQAGITLRPAGDTPLPSVEIAAPALPANELPDLAESWLWVHSQVSGSGNPAAALAGSSELSLSRLLCPRLLEPDIDYLACVVPAFELGRKAGLNEAIAAAELNKLDPAWKLAPTAPTQLTLPVYFHWHFRSGAGGDFESLVKLLKARPAPDSVGQRPVEIGQPGFSLPPAFLLHASLDVGGALGPITATDVPPSWPPNTEVPFQTELAKIVNAPGALQIANPAADPLLAPPLYGRWHAARAVAQPTGTQTHNWFDQLNLDPRHRAVAAFGTLVVQEHQEALMAAAWEQAGDMQQANQQLRQLQLAVFVGTSLHLRHFSQLGVDSLLRVGAPVFSRVKLAAASIAGVALPTLSAQFSRGALPVRSGSPAMRRLARPLGPINRRLVKQGVARPTSAATPGLVSKLLSGQTVFFAAAPTPALVTFNRVRSQLANPAAVQPFQRVTSDLVRAIPGRPLFNILPDGQLPPAAPPALVRPIIIKKVDNAAAKAFRNAVMGHLDKINVGRMGFLTAPGPRASLQELQSGLLAQLAPQRTLMALVRARVASSLAPASVPVADSLPVESVMFAPSFEQPMYEPLRDLSQDLLLPGLEAVPPNSVIGLQTNRRFVEAYLVGLNHEMGHELLWRGYPTDQRGTCFDRFWDTRGASTPRPDIAPIHLWGARHLGDVAGAPARERFVLLLRSELLRRYPNAVIYAARALVLNGLRQPSIDPGHEIHPAFRGAMQPDVSFFGFDLSVADAIGNATTTPRQEGYYIVIQEQPSEPRFGFPVDATRPAHSHLRLADGAVAGTPPPNLVWGRNGAHIAGITRHVPVRIAIHASQFVSQG